MTIAAVVLRGYSNGTVTHLIGDVVTRGYTPGEAIIAIPIQSTPGSAASRIIAGGGPSITASGGHAGITQSSRNKGVTGRR